MDKLVARLTKKSGRESRSKTHNKIKIKREVTTDTTEIQIVREGQLVQEKWADSEMHTVFQE